MRNDERAIFVPADWEGLAERHQIPRQEMRHMSWAFRLVRGL